MTNNYQKNAPKTTAELRLGVPATVNVAMEQIAEDMQDGLLALAVGAGLQVMSALMEADATALCGPKKKHDPTRTAVRHGPPCRPTRRRAGVPSPARTAP